MSGFANHGNRFSSLNQTKIDSGAFNDIFGVTKEAQKQYYSDMQAAVSAMADEDGDGMAQLSDGTTVDMKSITGMTVFSVHLQILQANMELINNIYTFVKNFESKLDNMLGN